MGLPSQIALQEIGEDLCTVIKAWPKLSHPLKGAVLAIIDSAKK
jgi:hypothetical protein